MRIPATTPGADFVPRRSGKKVYHINLLKRWYPAQPETKTVCLALDTSWQEETSDEDIPVTGMLEENLYPLKAETVEIDISVIGPNLSEGQIPQLYSPLRSLYVKPGRDQPTLVLVGSVASAVTSKLHLQPQSSLVWLLNHTQPSASAVLSPNWF